MLDFVSRIYDQNYDHDYDQCQAVGLGGTPCVGFTTCCSGAGPTGFGGFTLQFPLMTEVTTGAGAVAVAVAEPVVPAVAVPVV